MAEGSLEVSDALIKLNVPHGGLITDLDAYSPFPFAGRIVGPIFTVKVRSVVSVTNK
jgi:hypothetical protein